MKNKLLYTICVFCSTLSFFCAANSAWSINKCTLNGAITYTDQPCPEDAIATAFTAPVIPPADPAAAKQRHLDNQKELQKIRQQKTAEDKQQRQQSHLLMRQAKKNDAQKFKCKQLESKKITAQQQYEKIQFKGKSSATEKAQLRAKQAENVYEHHCGAGV